MQLLRAGKRMVLCGSLLILPVLSHAQTNISLVLDEYRVAGALAGDQMYPQAAISAAGGLIVWQDNTLTSLPGGGLRIRAQKLDANLFPSGEPFPVSSVNPKSKATGDQEKPRIALLPDDSAIVVWQGGKTGQQSIYARFIDPYGVPLKKDFQVSKPAILKVPKRKPVTFYQSTPAVAALAGGNIVIVWCTYGQDGDMQGVYGQLYSPAGTRIGTEFRVNATTRYNQRTPSVTGLADGNFVVAWVSEFQRNASSSVDIIARIFSGSGLPLSSELAVSTTTNNACANPAVAAADPGFAVVWSQNERTVLTYGNTNGVMILPGQTWRPPNSWDVYGRVFDNAGVPGGAPFRVNTWTYGDQYGPKIAAACGTYVVVWTSLGQDESWEGVYGQAFASSGVLAGPEFQANLTTMSHQIQPVIAADGVDRFLAVWCSFGIGTSFDLFGALYQQ